MNNERRTFTEKQPLTEMQRILVRGNLFRKRDKLVEESEKYLSPDSLAVKMIVSLILGAWFLFLRILSFGYPLMSDSMLANSSLRIAGVIMWLPVYALGILTPILIWAVVQKIRIWIKINRIDKMLNECKPCLN